MYTPPSTEQIIADLRSSVQAEVAGTDPWIWPNNLVPVLKAFGAAMRMGYLRLEFIHAQAFVSTAQADYLDWHGMQAGGLSRNPAGYAQGPAFTIADLGTVIYDGTSFARSDGQLFTSVGTVTAYTTPLRLFLRAQDPGELGNTDVGAQLQPISPILGVYSVEVDTGGLIGGRAVESDDSFRQRILFHKQNPPHGGSPSEYVEWGQTKTGVTRIFVKRATPGPGSVTIYFMMDGVGTGIPTAADIEQMQAILEVLAPADAEVIVAAPTPQPVNITIAGLVPDTAVMRDEVIKELKAMFLRRAEPASVTEPFVFARSWIDEAVAMAPKWQRSSISAPSGDVTVSTAGNIPTLGTVTFV
jgi:uncharacterized phage protein gp47/JayE